MENDDFPFDFLLDLGERPERAMKFSPGKCARLHGHPRCQSDTHSDQVMENASGESGKMVKDTTLRNCRDEQCRK